MKKFGKWFIEMRDNKSLLFLALYSIPSGSYLVNLQVSV